MSSLKHQGLFLGLKIIYHTLLVKFLPIFINNCSYSFLGFRIIFKNKISLIHMFYDLFCTNIYFFKTTSKRPVIIDIGANIGDSVIYFKHKYPDSIIYAFEPNKEAYDLLKKNISTNKFRNVSLFQFGLGKKNKKTKLFSDSSGTFYSSTTISPDSNPLINENKSEIAFLTNIIEIKKMSELIEIRKLKKIHLVKIDAEGNECEILEDIIPHFHKIENIIMEYHILKNMKKNSFDKIASLLSENKFKIHITGAYRNSENKTNSSVLFINANK